MASETIRRIYMPYCLQRLKDGRYIVLNRHYKPLGVISRDWVTYEDHPSALPITGLTVARAKKLSWAESDDLDCIYLYNDGCIPSDSDEYWKAYSERLKLLATLQIQSR